MNDKIEKDIITKQVAYAKRAFRVPKTTFYTHLSREP
jgi:hypothetical protein